MDEQTEISSTVVKPARNYALDLIKLLSMVAVVGLHTTGQFCSDSELSHFLYRTFVFAIPCFFMCSGFVLLGRKELSWAYSGKKILGIVRFVFLFILVCDVLRRMPPKEWVYDFFGSFFLSGHFSVFWFFGAMILLYALAPLLNRMYNEKESAFRFFVIALCAACALIHFTVLTNHKIEPNVCQTFRLWIWMFYFCLGGLLKKATFRVPAFLLVVMLVANYAVQYLSVGDDKGFYCEYFYGNPVVMAYSAGIFLFVKNIDLKGNLFLRTVPSLFVPVYAIHFFIIFRLMPLLERFYAGEFSGAALWVAVLTASVCISLCLVRVPYVNRVFKI